MIRLNEGIFIAESKSHDHLKNLKPLQETLAEQGIRVTNTLIEHETTYPAKIWRKELNLPDEVQVIRIRRLKKIGEEILAFEKKNLPLEIAEKFPSEKIPTEPFLSLLSQYPETEIYRIVYRKYVSHLLENYAEMMGLQEDSPILVRSGVYYNRLNLPIKAGRMIYPADKVELHFEVRKNERNPERLMLFKA